MKTLFKIECDTGRFWVSICNDANDFGAGTYIDKSGQIKNVPTWFETEKDAKNALILFLSKQRTFKDVQIGTKFKVNGKNYTKVPYFSFGSYHYNCLTEEHKIAHFLDDKEIDEV